MHTVETNIQDNGYRSGFAKRATNSFKVSLEVPTDLKAYEVQQAIALGLPDLSPQERDLLQFYSAFLNLTYVGDGKTSVWPSNRLACTLLGISVPTLRRYKASLEHRGYITRRYDRKNRPLKQGAIDLAPLLCQVRGLLKDIQGKFNAQQSYYHSLEEESSMEYSESAHPLTIERHKHINSINSSSVPIAPGKKTKDRKSNSSVDPILSILAVRELIGKSEALSSHFADVDWSDINASQIWELLDQSVRELFASSARCVQAWDRAKNSFGNQAIELLVVSLEDPKVKDGAKFLVFMAFKWRGELNLKPNLKRLLEIRKKSAQSQEKINLAAELRRRAPIFKNGSLSDDALISWFRKSVVDEGPDLIIIWVENEFVRSRILVDYLSIIQNGCLKEISVNVGSSGKEAQ